MELMRRLLVLLLLFRSLSSAHASEPKPLPEFTLTDHRGQPFSLASMRGRWSMLALGYTSCPDICPFVLTNLETVLTTLSTRMAPERLPRVIFLAVDPRRDAPALGDYMAGFHPDFLGVTGPEAEVARLVAGVDGVARMETAADPSGQYLVAHSAFVSVIDPAGRVVAKLSPPLDPETIADRLAGLLRGSPAG
jgi:protein SCO1/2